MRLPGHTENTGAEDSGLIVVRWVGAAHKALEIGGAGGRHVPIRRRKAYSQRLKFFVILTLA
ncbi:MAG: hypothetical protein VR68_16280 [Peptococcaceae bacterium BRH_c4a]|nr:MAG: hypothetical protein VR68_16280 [Peptococcaceae bacterium BRH_c4a]